MAKESIIGVVNNYLLNRFEQMLSSCQPLLSKEMFKSALKSSDDTLVRISIECKNGYSKTITLGEWRKFFIMCYHGEDK